MSNNTNDHATQSKTETQTVTAFENGEVIRTICRGLKERNSDLFPPLMGEDVTRVAIVENDNGTQYVISTNKNKVFCVYPEEDFSILYNPDMSVFWSSTKGLY